MNTLDNNNQITTTEESIQKFYEETDALLLRKEESLRDAVFDQICEAIHDGTFTKAKVRRQILSFLKKSIHGGETENPRAHEKPYIPTGGWNLDSQNEQTPFSAHQAIQESFSNGNIENIQGGMM